MGDGEAYKRRRKGMGRRMYNGETYTSISFVNFYHFYFISTSFPLYFLFLPYCYFSKLWAASLHIDSGLDQGDRRGGPRQTGRREIGETQEDKG